MIRAVTFDWWNTLVHNPSEDYNEHLKVLRLRAMQAIFLEAGLSYSLEQLSQAYDQQEVRLQAIWQAGGDLSPGEQVRILLGLLDSNREGEKLIARLAVPYSAAVLENLPALSPGAVETLQTLKGRGIKLGVISNTGRSSGAALREVQRRLGIYEFFDATIFSDELKIRKPRREIFEHALHLLGAAAHESAHVGDSLDTDIVGAKGAGMRAIWYTRDDRFAPAGADAVIDDLREVLRLVCG